jgi:site-specific DNA-methyltransferase (adenine-specific)/adenine-specific DNA-methyltransferase
MTDNSQLGMNLPNTQNLDNVEGYKFEPIKGYPMLHWKGKRPFTSTQFYPAQQKESHGADVDGWRNKIFWGDNLQVMSHLLKDFRGKVNLVYIDPPFDSKADYRLKIALRGDIIANDQNIFEEKQYADIWTNDDYLQFIFERLILIKELLSENGSLWFHCDWHRSHHIRCILDDIFGASNFQNEVIWQRTDPHNDAKKRLGWVHDTIFWYAKNRELAKYNWKDVVIQLGETARKEYSLVRMPDGNVINYSEDIEKKGRRFKLDDCTYKGTNSNRQFIWRGAKPSPKRVWSYSSPEEMDNAVDRGEFYLRDPDQGAARCRVSYLDEREGQLLQTIWTDTGRMKGGVSYPTEKPPSLIERIIKASSDEGDLVFDCFMGSGTTQAVAMEWGRRFIGADINLGAVQITTKRLLGIAAELEQQQKQGKLQTDDQAPTTYYTGFEVYNVNHYDVFRNPLEAKDLLLEALEIQRLDQGNLFDGEKDGRMVKIMPVNRIATSADLSEIITGLDYKTFERRQNEAPNKPVEKITLICMGHEPDLAATLISEVKPFNIDVEVVDILRDKSNLEFKRDSEAKIKIEGDYLIIDQFYPMNLLQKLSLQQENVEEWRELVESVMIDWNYDGAILEPKLVDIPDKKELVSGRYKIPEDAGTIRVKITDLLSESLEVNIEHG